MIHAVVGILQRDDRLLVSERPQGKPYSGYWEFPGGKIEENETAESAIRRELHEELGIAVIASRIWLQHTHHYPDKIVSLEIWRITEFSGEPHAREQQTLRWVSWQELLTLRLLEGNLVLLEKIKKLL